MITYNNQRVAVLIDTANLYHTAKHVYRSKVHFERLIHTIVGDRALMRAIAYAITSDNATETAFLETLTMSGIEVRTKPLITYRQGNQKADWDVGITIDAVALAMHIDTLILVSGDGDFAPLVRHMKSTGVRVEAAAFDQSVSQLLIDVVDWYHDLSQHTDTVLINQYNPTIVRNTKQNVVVPTNNVVSVANSDQNNEKVLSETPTSAHKISEKPAKVNRQIEVTKTISEQEKLATMRAGMKNVAMTKSVDAISSELATPESSPKKSPAKRRYYGKK